MGTLPPCPCCNADALVFNDKLQGAMGRIYSQGSEERLEVKLATRWDCVCWKLVRCERCARCVKHCACVAVATQKTGILAKLGRAEVKKLRKANEPLLFAEPEEKRAEKGRKR